MRTLHVQSKIVIADKPGITTADGAQNIAFGGILAARQLGEAVPSG